MTADAPRFFNVWLVQPNTVYRGVPYTVVCDWIQEGRLLGRDCVRTPGAPQWEYLDAHSLFAPYFMVDSLPRPDDAAEAMAPIDMDFETVMKKFEAGDEDVDMIPLIDISMVLLVFFMMTAQNLITASPFQIPSVKNAEIVDIAGNVVVTVAPDKDRPGRLNYYFTENYTQNYTQKEVLDMVSEAKKVRGSDMKVILQAPGNLPYEEVQKLQIGIEKLGINRITTKVKGIAGGEGAEGGSGG